MSKTNESGIENPTFVSSTEKLENGTTEDKKLNTKEEEDELEKSTWGNSIEFLMSCVAMSVGLGNIWRFPIVANKNGGGAFLIPYIIVLTIIGRPMYYLEMVLGQFSSRGCGKMFQKLSPVFRGIGIGQVFASTCVASYYCSLMAITFIYLINSFTDKFPWESCRNSWTDYLNSRNLTCVDKDTTATGSNTISSSEMYYRREILKELDDITDYMGAPDWKLTLTLLLGWFVTFMISAKGIRSSGKASYFLAIFPYIVMIVLLIRASTLEGATDGMMYFIETDWSKLLDGNVWYAAVTQCFFSLNIGFGNIITLASFNKFDHNISRDAFIITTLDTFTSLLSGVTIFGILGNLAYELGVPPKDVLAGGGGAGLAFISYPEALSKFTFAPWLFAIAFFFMLFVLGVGSLAALHANLNTLIKETFPTLPDWFVAAVTATGLFLFGLIYVTPGGQYTLDLVDHFGGTFVIFVCVCLEVAVVCGLYGVNNVCDDLEFMTKKKVSIFWRICWTFIVPIFLAVIFIYFLVSLTPMTYGIFNLRYPLGLEILGWGILAVTVIQIICWVIYYLYINRHGSFKVMISNAFSTKTWGPAGQNRTQEWKIFKENKTRSSKLSKGPWIIKKLKMFLGR
ncbi:unnamed protein product [Phyllotreta striolata]|uniref:Sodium-dependent nutrient amino acid transporter 1 n=1 Tax=Phyllotreta striolata TaxID=444603 RepID=A0A9N9TWM9_PHYSR|nr:unnamed protein product [Phyllotreta striolata]